MIISASRRTDIPAFYADWFINRIRKGYCYAPNPLYPQQKTRPISLKSSDVEFIVFWTRDPKPLIKYLPELDSRGYKYYFQYTVIGYPRNIDPKSPGIESAIKTFKDLSCLVGKEKVIWRYDPILLSDVTSQEWHRQNISKIAKGLKEATERLIISFIDPYRKTILGTRKKTDGDIRLSSAAFKAESYRCLAKWISLRMKKIKLQVFTCSEDIDLADYGINRAKCIDDRLIGRILKREFYLKKDSAQRKACGCVIAKDIGVNDTCLFGCRYCYANRSFEASEKNFKKHDSSKSYLFWPGATPGFKNAEIDRDC